MGEMQIPVLSSVRSIVVLNLPNYGSGRNPWSKLKPDYLEKRGFVQAYPNDDCLENFGLKHGWLALMVMAEVISSKHIEQMVQRLKRRNICSTSLMIGLVSLININLRLSYSPMLVRTQGGLGTRLLSLEYLLVSLQPHQSITLLATLIWMLKLHIVSTIYEMKNLTLLKVPFQISRTFVIRQH
ncbi:uncharacterized protein LOC121805246 isoform X1 [Salvia splendens]|uniref:uncharacterized protein LOC121805246 isoform X1 n=1 Tax=Salvia splendens TaxID=180675 RepID=UPI001C2547BC|nr:uncharacterized protein LOC121805246 isoform X1 [Salvia splendens]